MRTIFCRLTRWIDRVTPFDFVIEHVPRSKIGLTDNLSRHPVGKAQGISRYDNTFTVEKTNLIIKLLGFTPVASSSMAGNNGSSLFQPINMQIQASIGAG